jgi:site-specific recombinase XerD
MAVALKVVSSATWLDQILEDFERAMLRRQLSPATVRTYRWSLQDLFEGMKIAGLKDIRQLNRDILEQWQDTMVDRKWKPRSRALALTAARQLIRWADDRGLVELRLEKALARVKTPDGRPRPIPSVDLDKIKTYLLPRRPHMGIVALRDRALFFYLLSTGARVSEALQVRRDDLDAPVVRQKGGSEKVLLMPPAAREVIDDYLRVRIDDVPWLWVGFRTNTPMARLGPPGVREIWRKIATKVGVKPWTTHQLRHTCATELLAAGIPELVVAEHLGHHGLASLHIYGQVRPAARQKAVDVMEQLVQAPRPVLLPKISRRERY